MIKLENIRFTDDDTTARTAIAKVAAGQPLSRAEELAKIKAMKLTAKERAAVDAFESVNGVLLKYSRAAVVADGERILKARAADRRTAIINDVYNTKPDNFHIIRRAAELPRFRERLREECRRQLAEWPDRFKELGVLTMTAGDFEGTGIDAYTDLSIGFSIWLPLLDEGYYLAYGHVDMRDHPSLVDIPDNALHNAETPQLTRTQALAAIMPYLTAASHGKSFHMGSTRYDLHVAKNDGYTIAGCRWDSRDAMYLLNEHEDTYGLKPLTEKYGEKFGIDGPIYTFEDMFGNRSPAPFDIELVGIYAIKDVLYGWRLTEWQFELMKTRGRLFECYARIDCRIPEVDVELCRAGFIVDLDELAALDAEFTPQLKQAEADVVTAYGIDADFVYTMDRQLNAAKIADWIDGQKVRIAKWNERRRKLSATMDELTAAGKTHLKKYEQAAEAYAKLLEEPPVSAIEDNAPRYIEEFSITNSNHLAYLIYDVLGVKDRTELFKRGKERSTAKDVLELYYEEEEALKPLAVVAMYEKLLNTYIRKIPNALDRDGRIHSEFKAGGTNTGRYSSSGYKGRPLDVLEAFGI